MPAVVYRSPWSAVRAALSRRLLHFVLAGRKPDVLPLHVVLPGDEVSNEILLAGVHEGALLEPLFGRFLSAYLPQFAHSVALDVGANIGNHSLFFSRFFRQVVAVEPNPLTLHVLRANAALSGAPIEVLPVGFGETAEELTFYSNQRGNLGASGFAFAGGPTDAANGIPITCSIVRGDEALAGVAQIGLIKLDVEGAELSALRGLSAVLQRDQPVVLFESLQAEGELGGRAIFDFLKTQGYTHFYCVESSALSQKRTLFGWFKRLTQGEVVSLQPLQTPESGRVYLMILALPHALRDTTA